jgi:hypothetical protein
VSKIEKEVSDLLLLLSSKTNKAVTLWLKSKAQP